MFEFAKNINEINAGQEYYSAACVMRHLAWKILIQRNRSEDDGEFEFVDSHDTLTVKLHVSFRLSVVIPKTCSVSFIKCFISVWGKIAAVVLPCQDSFNHRFSGKRNR